GAPDGGRMASGGEDNCVRVWDVSTGRNLAALPFFESVESLAWSPDGRYLATGAAEWGHQVRIWDTATWQPVREFDYQGRIRSVAWSPDGKSVAAAFERIPDQKYTLLQVWDVASGKSIAGLQHPSGESAVA